MLNILLLALIKRDLQYIVRYPDSPALQRTCTENSKQIFPEKKLCGHSPKFHIYVSMSDLYIPTIELPILLQEICGPILLDHQFRYHDCWITNSDTTTAGSPILDTPTVGSPFPDTTTVGSPIQMPQLLVHQFQIPRLLFHHFQIPQLLDHQFQIPQLLDHQFQRPQLLDHQSRYHDCSKMLVLSTIIWCTFSKSFTVSCQTFVHLCLESSSGDPHRASLQHPQVSGE
jgi:hypothetical protein